MAQRRLRMKGRLVDSQSDPEAVAAARVSHHQVVMALYGFTKSQQAKGQNVPQALQDIADRIDEAKRRAGQAA